MKNLNAELLNEVQEETRVYCSSDDPRDVPRPDTDEDNTEGGEDEDDDARPLS